MPRAWRPCSPRRRRTSGRPRADPPTETSATRQESAGTVADPPLFRDAGDVKSLSRGPDTSRSGLIGGLLSFTLALAAVLTWQAQVSVRYHRAAVEKVLRD